MQGSGVSCSSMYMGCICYIHSYALGYMNDSLELMSCFVGLVSQVFDPLRKRRPFILDFAHFLH